MMHKLTSSAVLAALAFAGSSTFAAPVLLQSDSVRVNITDRGVFSSLRYDPLGGGSFPGDKDYVSPGIPFEGFEVRLANLAGGTSVYANSNSAGASLAGVTSVAAGSFDFGASWTGGNSLFELTHLFYFDAGDERVNIQTTLTALTDLNDVRVSRAVDPDPDNYPGGSAGTNNQRGIAAQSVPVSDFVGSLGAISGYPLGLYYGGTITHNTGIVSYCCGITDADNYLAGGELGDSSSGDHGIGIGFALGDLASGQSMVWNYAYVMGGSLDAIDIPDDPTVPEPGTLMLSALALLGAVGARRRAVAARRA